MLSLRFKRKEDVEAGGAIITVNKVFLPKGPPWLTVFIDCEIRVGVTKL
jgi:hypothetical protein